MTHYGHRTTTRGAPLALTIPATTVAALITGLAAYAAALYPTINTAATSITGIFAAITLTTLAVAAHRAAALY